MLLTYKILLLLQPESYQKRFSQGMLLVPEEIVHEELAKVGKSALAFGGTLCPELPQCGEGLEPLPRRGGSRDDRATHQ